MNPDVEFLFGPLRLRRFSRAEHTRKFTLRLSRVLPFIWSTCVPFGAAVINLWRYIHLFLSSPCLAAYTYLPSCIVFSDQRYWSTSDTSSASTSTKRPRCLSPQRGMNTPPVSESMSYLITDCVRGVRSVSYTHLTLPTI